MAQGLMQYAAARQGRRDPRPSEIPSLDIYRRAKSFAQTDPVEAGLIGASMLPVPVVSDAAGFAGDVLGMIKRPEDRTAANAGMAALGLLPFVPAFGATVRAYHGSPHDFDRFSVDKIGTGEGAQAYGHGLYFAESPDVAREYQQRLANIDASEFDKIGIPPKEWNAATMFARTADATQAESAARDFANWTGREVTPDLVEAYRKTLSSRGRFYEVDIDADPPDFLDWDLPLSEQPEKVRKAFLDDAEMADAAQIQARLDDDLLAQLHDGGSKLSTEKRRQLEADLRAFTFTAETRGDRVWQNMVEQGNRAGAIGEHLDPNSPPMRSGGSWAAETLKNKGIKGIRYKDAMSRGKDGGSYNYVVFDDSLIDIKNKK